MKILFLKRWSGGISQCSEYFMGGVAGLKSSRQNILMREVFKVSGGRGIYYICVYHKEVTHRKSRFDLFKAQLAV